LKNILKNVLQYSSGGNARMTSISDKNPASKRNTGTTGTLAAVVAFWRQYRTPLLLVALVTMLHYNTAIHIHAAHGIYRRLYYFPIILAAFRGGTRGGLGASVLVIALYIPHAMGLIGFDPANPVEKTLEMVLYVAVGLLSGILVSRINAARDGLAKTATDLQVALDEKTAMEDELVRSTRLAAVGRLSAGLAHEIRNPLASIKGSAEVISDDYPADHPKGRMLTILLEEANRLNQVLTRFLTFARTEPGRAHQVDLVEEVRAVVELTVHQEGAAALAVADPPAGFGPVLANQEQLRQVLLNLVLNASAAAGPDGAVTIEFAFVDRRPACLIQDNGPGFTTEAIAQFGSPFFSTREGGTGLGLATSLRIVEDFGGTLSVDPDYNSGARVILTLPPAPGNLEG
jgi:two-component system, NtrC family, sensor histidine kinase HydH